MTNNPNGPRRAQVRRRVVAEREGKNAGAIAGFALAAVVILGVMFWVKIDDRTIATTDSARIERTTPAPSTTGQGGTAVTRAPAPTLIMDPPER